MAKIQDVFNLVRYGLNHQDSEFRQMVKVLINSERSGGRENNALRLEELFNTAVRRFTPQPNGYFKSAVNEQMIDCYCYIKKPQVALSDIALSDMNIKVIIEIIQEQKQSTKLAEHGLEPRSRILLQGPPGNGKTSLAEAIANTMNIPFLVVRQEQLITSLLGKTAQNLYNVFSYAVKQPCVLFLDEFDALGCRRNRGNHDSGELNRVVNSMLKQIDALPSYVILIAATNRGDILDDALWRRFQVSVTLPMPNRDELARYYEQYMDKYHMKISMEPTVLAEETMPCSYAKAEELMTTLRRKMVLHDGKLNAHDEIKQWKACRKE